MAAKIPYLASPGSIVVALDKIKSASTPEKVTLDFIKTKIGLKGGTGNSMLPFLKKIGMVNQDGSPSELYKRFRNSNSSGVALAEACKMGYKELYDMNEYAHDLSDKELKGIMVQILGCEEDSAVLDYTLRTFKNIKKSANFDLKDVSKEETDSKEDSLSKTINKLDVEPSKTDHFKRIGMNLSYTINLNLPATPDIAVFNAIFKSLKENILKHED